MKDNPYAPPESDSGVVGILSGSREDLRGVAKAQKGILVCILLYFAAVISQFVLPSEVMLFVAIGMLIVGVAAAVFVFSLAIKVYGQGLGIVLGILSLIPCVGLIVLLIVNGKATGILKQNGVKVGLLGADAASI